MIRDISENFLPKTALNYKVRVFHGKPQSTGDISGQNIIFILNPQKLTQQEFRLLLHNDVTYILYYTKATEDNVPEANPIKILLHDKKVNEHLSRIINLGKNVLELHVEKNIWWDFLGISASYTQLFSIKDKGYCFKEYPIVDENTMNLDDVFLQEYMHSINPRELVTKYLQIIEAFSVSDLHRNNISNAFQKVFKFYKTDREDFTFDLLPDNVEFLVDVLQIDSLYTKFQQRAEIVCALASAGSYFMHSGYPEAFKILIKKLIDLQSLENGQPIKYKYISNKEILLLKNTNAFLYYQLTCRIPNKYTIALLDLFLAEVDSDNKMYYESQVNKYSNYLKGKIVELSLMHESPVWEFKRDQEIGAISGTLGLVELYKNVFYNGNISAYEQADIYFKNAIEYANPGERNRDINYYAEYRLAWLMHNYDANEKNSWIEDEIDRLAGFYKDRFNESLTANVFDIMIFTEIIAIANTVLGSEKAIALHRQIGFDYSSLNGIINEKSYQYAIHLAIGYLLYCPEEILGTLDLEKLIEKTVCYFSLNNKNHDSNGIIDLIALKFMLAHSCYLSTKPDSLNREILTNYRKRIEGAPIYSRWASESIDNLQECILNSASRVKILKLIFKIPY